MNSMEVHQIITPILTQKLTSTLIRGSPIMEVQRMVNINLRVRIL